jgi:hypothetical protein
MTPLAGFVIAIIAGWITRDGRRAAAVAIIPFLAVTALQTWGIAAGHGVSPPDTVWPLSGAISYYVVQLIIMAATLGVAVLLGAVRAQPAGSAGTSGEPGRRVLIAFAVDAVLTAVYLLIAWLVSAPVRHHSSTGSPPAYGLIGIGVLLVSLIVLGVLARRGRRARSAGGSVPARPDTAVAGSRIA